MAPRNVVPSILFLFLFTTALAAQEWAPFGPPGGAVTLATADPATGTVYLYGPTLGIHRLEPGGSVWERVATPQLPPPNDGRVLSSLGVANGRLFAVLGCCMLYGSEDGGLTWRRISFDFGDLQIITKVQAIGDTLFMKTHAPSELFRSLDRGATWTSVETFDPISFLVANGRTLYTYGTSGLDRRIADGVWERIRTDAIAQLLLNGDTLIALNDRAELFRSEDGGTTWTAYPVTGGDPTVVENDTTWVLHTLALHDDTIVMLRGGALFTMPIAGSAWTPWGVVEGAVDLIVPTDAATFVFGQGGTWRRDPATGAFRRFEVGQYGHVVRQVLRLGDTIVVRTPTRLHVTVDGGATWVERSGPTGDVVKPLATDGRRLYAAAIAAEDGIFLSDDLGATWRSEPIRDAAGDFFPVEVIHVQRDTLFLGGRGIARGVPGAWTVLSTPMMNQVSMIAGEGEMLFVKAHGDPALQLARSSDFGDTWEMVDLYEREPRIFSLAYANGMLYIGTGDDGLHRSTNGGRTWHRSFTADNPLDDTTLVYVNSLDVFGDTVFIRVMYLINHDGQFELIHASTNRGDSWQTLAPPPGSARTFTLYGDRLLAGTATASVWISRLTLGVDRSATESGLRVAHDPARDLIRWSTAVPTSYAIELYTIAGEHVGTVESGNAEAGAHAVALPALPGGAYLCVVRVEGGSAGVVVMGE